MPSRFSLFLAAAVIVLLGYTGCARESSEFTLSIEALRQLSRETTAGITHEEVRGTVLVTVIDKRGDGHIHRLTLGDTTRAQALELLRQKQLELQQNK